MLAKAFPPSSCLQSAERREAVVSSLVKYLGPEAAAFIHYEDKVSCPLAIKSVCFGAGFAPQHFRTENTSMKVHLVVLLP